MPGEALIIPLWGKLVLLSLAKKGLLLTAGYLYGFPRLYRRSQKLVRYIAREPAARQEVGGYVRAAFRLPEKLLLSQPKVKMSPALQYLSLLPNRLAPRSRQPRPVQQTQKRVSAYKHLKTSFASSPLLQRHSESLAAGRAKVIGLREQFANSNTLQSLVEGRAAHAVEMWSKIKQRPYNLIPTVR